MNLQAGIIPTILASAFLLDIIFYRYQRRIYEQFYRWWFHLSELNTSTVVARVVERLLHWETKLCGRKMISLRSLSIAAALTSLTTVVAAVFFLPRDPTPVGIQVAAIFLLVLFNLPVGLLSFLITRALLRVLRLADSLPLALAIGLVAVMAVELIIFAFWFATGGIAATTLKNEYLNGVSVDGSVTTFVFFIFFALGYTHGLLHMALVPLYIVTAFAGLVLVLHLLGKGCVFAENFFAWQVETLQFASFTVICSAIIAIVEIFVVLGETVPARWVTSKLGEAHETAAKRCAYNGIATTWNVLLSEKGNNPTLTTYLHKVADGLDKFGDQMVEGTADYQKVAKLFVPRVFDYLERKYGLKPNSSESNPSPQPN